MNKIVLYNSFEKLENTFNVQKQRSIYQILNISNYLIQKVHQSYL